MVTTKKLIALIVILFYTQLLGQQTKPPITFDTPKTWILVKSGESSGATQFLYSTSTEKSEAENLYPSNAMVQYFKLPPEGSPADMDWIANSRRKDGILIDAGKDGQNWKSFIWTSYRGKQQIIHFYRIGIAFGYGVEAFYSFPHILPPPSEKQLVLTITKSLGDDAENGGIYTSTNAVIKMISEFNQLCSTLKISNSNQYTTAIQLIEPPPNAKAFRKVDGVTK
jgi:hypothetical protein